MERSLVLVKPDGVQRGLIGEVITRLENRGLRLVAAKFLQVSPDLASTMRFMMENPFLTV
jgi:nucleoside-diphosphate kinase